MDAGKGDKRRPMQISYDEYAENWDNIFKPKKKTTELGKDEDHGNSIISSDGEAGSR